MGHSLNTGRGSGEGGLKVYSLEFTEIFLEDIDDSGCEDKTGDDREKTRNSHQILRTQLVQ